jgi:type IV pilus assembly protein PilV
MSGHTLIRRHRRSVGFSLVEVLVALIVFSVGLLGIAKMEALALSTTATSSRRSIAALQASSLASSMHLNRGFWESTAASGIQVNITGNTVSNPPGGSTPDCDSGAAAPCSAVNLAAYDLNAWAVALQAVLPNDVATVQCNASTPLECSITIQWSEQAVAMYSAQAQSASTATTETNGTSAAFQNPTYTLYVEP